MWTRKVKVDLWHWFGIIAAFGLAIYASLLLYDYLYQKKLPSITVQGNYSKFENPFNHITPKHETEVIIMDSVRKSLVGLENRDLVSAQIYSYIEEELSKNYCSESGRYKTFWEFTIHNRGNKNLGQAELKIPFDGVFVESRETESQTLSNFNQLIDLGTLYAGENVKIYVWTQEPLGDYIKYLTEKTNLTYHGGSAEIIYPVKAGGLWAWNIKMQNKPAMIGGAILIFFLAIIIILFYNLGVNSAQDNFENVIPFGGKDEDSPVVEENQ